jgi:protocatechuate 3,4-dioxygenase beta subunit
MKKGSRRKFLAGALAFVGVGALTAWISRRKLVNAFIFNGNFNADELNNAPSIDDDICILTSKQDEGPFYYPSPERSSIVEDKTGKALELNVQVINYPDCTPLEGAVVEIWHCDAEGVYSGYPEELSRNSWNTLTFIAKKGESTPSGEMHADPINDHRFLRGLQRTDAEGKITFKTILPGWYEGRVPHIHARISLNDKVRLTTQFYFEDELCDQVYTMDMPYSRHGKSPLRFKNDIVLSNNKTANGLLLKIPMADKLTASAKVGIQIG